MYPSASVSATTATRLTSAAPDSVIVITQVVLDNSKDLCPYWLAAYSRIEPAAIGMIMWPPAKASPSSSAESMSPRTALNTTSGTPSTTSQRLAGDVSEFAQREVRRRVYIWWAPGLQREPKPHCAQCRCGAPKQSGDGWQPSQQQQWESELAERREHVQSGVATECIAGLK